MFKAYMLMSKISRKIIFVRKYTLFLKWDKHIINLQVVKLMLQKYEW